MAEKLVVEFHFGGVTMGSCNVVIQFEAIGFFGFHEAAQAHGPARRDPLQHGTLRIAAGIGGIIPGTGVEERPVEKLSTRIMGKAVGVEDITRRNFADGDHQAVTVDAASDLILVVRHPVANDTDSVSFAT